MESRPRCLNQLTISRRRRTGRIMLDTGGVHYNTAQHYAPSRCQEIANWFRHLGWNSIRDKSKEFVLSQLSRTNSPTSRHWYRKNSRPVVCNTVEEFFLSPHWRGHARCAGHPIYTHTYTCQHICKVLSGRTAPKYSPTLARRYSEEYLVSRCLTAILIAWLIVRLIVYLVVIRLIKLDAASGLSFTAAS